jgi:hypothetical protein
MKPLHTYRPELKELRATAESVLQNLDTVRFPGIRTEEEEKLPTNMQLDLRKHGLGPGESPSGKRRRSTHNGSDDFVSTRIRLNAPAPSSRRVRSNAPAPNSRRVTLPSQDQAAFDQLELDKNSVDSIPFRGDGVDEKIQLSEEARVDEDLQVLKVTEHISQPVAPPGTPGREKLTSGGLYIVTPTSRLVLQT